MKEKVILVDKDDQKIGEREKIDAHLRGDLHRAFSIFIFNSEGQVLLQKRALGKYHSPGLWANACCGHPRPGEDLIQAAHRRLKEEMGFDCKLSRISSFFYETKFKNGLKENEIDHILIGRFDGTPKINTEEASNYRWSEVSKIEGEIREKPEIFCHWFKIAIKVVNHALVSGVSY